jgi:CO dehydrogenase/acetyl-CoA synthase epsilon subunit
MSFFPIPADENYTGQKKLKTAKDEKIPKPKVHTIKDVKKKHKQDVYSTKSKISEVGEILKNTWNCNYNYETLVFTCYTEYVFRSMLEARTFIKTFEKQILDYASN